MPERLDSVIPFDRDLRLTQGNDDLAYAQDRLKIGAIHERIGLPVKTYLGMYSFYLRAVADAYCWSKTITGTWS